MKISFLIIINILLICNIFQLALTNDFPSLLVANATIAILLDHEYLDVHYGETLKVVKEHVERILREDLKESGLNIKYYSWTKINFNKDFTAAISITNCRNSWNTYYKAKLETIIYIALTEPDCPRFPDKEAIMIPMVSIGEELPQILLDVRASNSVNWKNAIILYDDMLDRDTISRVVKSLSTETLDLESSAIPLSMFKIINNFQWKYQAEIKEKLSNIPTSYIGTNFIVFVSNPEVVLKFAGEIGMMDATSQWLFLVSDSSNTTYNNISVILDNVVEGGNIALALNTTQNIPCKIDQLCFFGEILRHFVFALMNMYRQEQTIYTQISDEEWESIRLTKLERKNGILVYMKNRLRDHHNCSSCSSWIFQAIETWGLQLSNNDDYSSDGSRVKINVAGNWEPINGLSTNDSIFPHLSHGFRNKVLPVAIYHNPPWQIINYDNYGNIISMDGIIIHILKELSEKLNFTYNLKDIPREVNDLTEVDAYNISSYYNRYESTLTIPKKVLELILNNKVLFAAVGVTVNGQYTGYFNFSMPISVQSYSLLISRPKELSRLYLFTAPFSTNTWLCLGFILIIIGPILYVINYYSPFYEYFNFIRKGGMFKMGNCFWYIYGALLQQGGMYLPKSDSGRLIIGSWWLVVLVIVTTYCGNLVAFLTFPKMETPISSVSQLLKIKNGISWGVKTETYLEKYLKESDNDNYKRLHKAALYYPHETNEIIENVRRGKHVYIDWKINLQYIMKREFLLNDRCDLGISAEEFLSEKIAMMLPLNSPYIKIFNREIYKLLQMGFIEKWLTEYLPKKDRCWNVGRSLDIDNHTVNLDDMQGCFLVLIIGITGSIIIIFGEFCLKYRYLVFKSKRIKPFTE